MTVTANTQPVVVGITIQMPAKEAQDFVKVLNKASEALLAMNECSHHNFNQNHIDRGMIDDVMGSIENALRNANAKCL